MAEIFEEGIQLVDMVYLRREITKVLKTERLILGCCVPVARI